MCALNGVACAGQRAQKMTHSSQHACMMTKKCKKRIKVSSIYVCTCFKSILSCSKQAGICDWVAR